MLTEQKKKEFKIIWKTITEAIFILHFIHFDRLGIYKSIRTRYMILLRMKTKFC